MAIKLKLTHNDYEVSNGVWAREGIRVSGRSLSHYMTGVLGIEYKSVGSSVMGVADYYVRNCFGLEYSTCSSSVRGSIIDGLYEMDPWNRKFPIFPYEKLTGGEYGYRGYYSDTVNSVYYNDETKIERENIGHNVMILITSVNRQSVYCVDILAGKYGSW